jgi:hypothetical protein
MEVTGLGCIIQVGRKPLALLTMGSETDDLEGSCWGDDDTLVYRGSKVKRDAMSVWESELSVEM